MKLKTLKDLEAPRNGSRVYLHYNMGLRDVKEEVIKWLKKDLEDFENINKVGILSRWMTRFNLTEEDLK